MDLADENEIIESIGTVKDSPFAIHGNLDGEQPAEYVERDQFIGLIIGDEEFLLSISHVSEINMLSPISYVPNANEFIDGVINLRGTILPALNLRKMMGFDRGRPSGASRIIIAKHEDFSFGMIVDGITFVVALLPTEIDRQNLPTHSVGSDYISGVTQREEKVRGILDLQRILQTVAGTSLDDSDSTASA